MPMFFAILFPLRIAPGVSYGGGGWYWDWLWYGLEGVDGALANDVPQFAQKFALSGLGNPQFGQCMVMPTLTDLGTQTITEFQL
jgi:hypothetical protein